MIFDVIREGDIVMWDKRAILRRLDCMENGSMWRHEELDCFLQVTNLKNSALEQSCELVCVKGCDQHLTTSLSRGEYEDYFQELGTDIFVFAESLSDLSEMYAGNNGKEEEIGYDFVRDSKYILDKVCNGTLPISRKRVA